MTMEFPQELSTEQTFSFPYYFFLGNDVTKWTKNDGGFEFHIVSSIAEWLLTVFVGVYIITFTKEFWVIHFSEPEIILKET